MKDQGILYQTPLVEKILADEKLQTRRVAMPDGGSVMGKFFADKGEARFSHLSDPVPVVVRCRFGLPGTVLWVREAWNIGFGDYADPSTPRIRFRAQAPEEKRKLDEFNRRHALTGMQKLTSTTKPVEIPPLSKMRVDQNVYARWRPGIHLPRWAARLELKLLEVRLQRVQQISEADAKAEGVEAMPGGAVYPGTGAARVPSYRAAFRKLWDEINGDREGCSWEQDPWVFALTFERIKR